MSIFNRKTAQNPDARAVNQSQIDAQPKEGAVLSFTRPIGKNGCYTYAAIRGIDGLWYLTGTRAPQGIGWIDLLKWSGNVQIHFLTKDPTKPTI